MDASQKKTRHQGFTMVEIVVMMAIVTALSGIVLFSFGGLNEGAALNRGARELALAIRRAQNMALAITEVTVGNPPAPRLVSAIGIQLTQNQSTYLTFGDLDPDGSGPGSRNNTYDSALGEQIGSAKGFERNVRISCLRVPSTDPSCRPTVTIILTAPEGAVSLFDGAGTPFAGGSLKIELTPPNSSAKRTITVRISGQVNIK